MSELPPISFVVIGAQKAGSTFLQDMLDSHPQIHVPRPELPHFQDPDYHRIGVEDLWRHFPPHVRNRTLGLKRPNYLAAAEVPDRIARALPRARIVVVLRDPVKRLVSAWWHYVRYRSLPIVPPDVGIRQLLAGELSRSYPRAPELLEFGRYGTHLRRWLGVFPRDQVDVIVFEELVRDPQGVVAPLVERLGLPAVTLDIPDLRMSGISNATRLRYWHATHPLVYRTDADGLRFSTRSALLERVVHGIDRFALGRIFRRQGPTDLGADLEARLRSFYAEEIVATEHLVGRSMPWDRA